MLTVAIEIEARCAAKTHALYVVRISIAREGQHRDQRLCGKTESMWRKILEEKVEVASRVGSLN